MENVIRVYDTVKKRREREVRSTRCPPGSECDLHCLLMLLLFDPENGTHQQAEAMDER